MHATEDHAPPDTTDKPHAPPKRLKWLRRIGLILLTIILLLCIARPMMPGVVRWYANRVISQSPVYRGQIGDVDLHLYRGAYTIHDVRLVKTTGDIPVPLFSAKHIDLAIEWPAIMHGRVVGQIVMMQPELNFVDDPGSGESQNGAGGPWLAMIRDLFPFKINSARIVDGSVHFRTYQKAKPVDVYLDQLQGSIDNLSNIRDELKPLITTISATGTAMHQGKFELKMALDPFSYEPSFHLGVRLLGLDVTRINDLLRTYGGFDFKRGWFDLVMEVDVKEGALDGYVKPLFRNLKVFDLVQDIKEDDVLQVFWQALIGTAAEILKNQPRDQVATLIPITGELSGTQPDILATIGNILRNAFVRAYLPRFESNAQQLQGMEFGAPSISDPISAFESQ